MAKRRYTTKRDSITGRRYKTLKRDYYKDPFSGKVKKHNSFKVNYGRRRRSKKDDEAFVIAAILMAIVFVIFVISKFAQEHPTESIMYGIGILFIVVLAFWKIPKLNRKIPTFLRFESTEKRDETISQLIKQIKQLKILNVRNEEDLEKQLFQRLDALGYNVEQQKTLAYKKVIDLVINNNIGIELKIAESMTVIRNLIGQSMAYQKHLDKLIVVILDYGKVTHIDEYLEDIKNVNREKISVVVLNGPVKRRKKKEEYIAVKKVTRY